FVVEEERMKGCLPVLAIALGTATACGDPAQGGESSPAARPSSGGSAGAVGGSSTVTGLIETVGTGGTAGDGPFGVGTYVKPVRVANPPPPPISGGTLLVT